ncbi:MAG: translocation/assembly module TamB domain-containing protein [Sphingorhabdus sp.]
MSPPWKWLVALAAFAATLVLAAVGSYFWLDTSSGRAFVARQIAAYEFENGLNIRIGEIRGSLYSEAELIDVRIQDEKGTFAQIPVARLDWHPFDYLYGIVSVDSLAAGEVRVRRLPELRLVPDRGEPFFPDLDIRIGKLQLDRVVFDPAITGEEQELQLMAKARIFEARAQVDATAQSSKGDRLAVKLDAVPDKDLLGLALRFDGPRDGLLAGLIGVDAPVEMRIDGKGSWTKWDGTFAADAGAGRRADLALSARNGRFTAIGDVAVGQPDSRNMIADVLAPAFRLDLVGDFADSIGKVEGSLVATKLRMDVSGSVDLSESLFRKMIVNLQMPQKVAIANGFESEGASAKFVVDGAMIEPRIDYAISTKRLRVGEFVLTGLTAQGNTQFENGVARIPVMARARRVEGLDFADQRLFEDVRLNGDLAYSEGRLLTQRMNLRSNRITTSIKGVADFSKGRLAASIKGQVDRYRIESVGLFDIDADLGLKSRMQSDYALTGTVRGRSNQLFSDGLRNVLGGQILVRAGIGISDNGIVQINSASLITPKLRMDRGRGRYVLASGAISFAGNGYSRDYGPVGLALSGTLAAPVAKITAQRPGMGIGLADVNALVRRSGTGLAILFDAQSDYGPIDGDLDVILGRDALVLDVRRADFSGIRFNGRLQQLPSGSFSGQLVGSGSGFEAMATLSAEGRFQRAVIKGYAVNAELRGAKTLRIGRGQVNADILLIDQPKVIADIQVGDTWLDDLYLAAGRAKIDYQNGSGYARLLAEGRSQFPFRIAANGRLAPGLWSIALRGRANGISFASAGPVRIVPENGGYGLLPSKFEIGGGSAMVEGRYTGSLQLRSKMDKVDLAILNPLLPGYELDGRASGVIDWNQSSFEAVPQANGRIEITRFSRNSLGVQSQPVDISLRGRLDAGGGNLAALIERRGTNVGKLQVKLGVLPGGTASWTEKLLDAPLSGGIRFKGPADLLFSLAALADQTLVGPAVVAADFSGSLGTPQLTGLVRSDNLVYEHAAYGTRLTKMRIRGRFNNDVLELREISAKAGDGTVSGKGVISLSLEKGFPAKIDLDLNRARLARSELVSSAATGSIAVTNSADTGPLVSGTLALPETRFRIVRQTAAAVSTLTGVRRKSASGPARITGDANPVSSLPSNWKLDIKIVAPDELFISGMGMESEWKADLRVTGTSDAPFITGDLQLIRGTLGFAGRSFALETGRLTFNGGEYSNPSLRVVAASEVDGTTVRVEVRGTGKKPEIFFTSSPALPQDEIMARILFGNSVAELSAIQAVQLAASLNSLRAAPGGLNPLGVLQSATGIDRLRILNPDDQTGRGTAVALGQYITNDVYVEIITDARGYTASQIEISLTPALSVLSQLSSYGTSNVSVRYRKDY